MSGSSFQKPRNPLEKIRDKDPRAIARNRVVRALNQNDATAFTEALRRAQKHRANDKVFCAAVLHDITDKALPELRLGFVAEVLAMAPSDLSEQPFVVSAALADRACDILPLLSHAGCRLARNDHAGYRNLARLLAEGAWPYPDLVFPSLWQHEGSRKEIFQHLFALSDRPHAPPLLEKAAFCKLHALPHDTRLMREAMHYHLQDMGAEEELVKKLANAPDAGSLLQWFCQVGWLDMDRFLAQAGGKLLPSMHALLQLAILDGATPALSMPAARSMRL